MSKACLNGPKMLVQRSFYISSCHPGFWRFSGHIILVPLVTDDGSIAKISVMSRLHANGPRTKGEEASPP